MTIEYAVRCDGCGQLVATSRSSARAARAEAQLNRGGSSAGGEDWCASCRRKRIDALNEAAMAAAGAKTHSITTRRR